MTGRDLLVYPGVGQRNPLLRGPTVAVL